MRKDFTALYIFVFFGFMISTSKLSAQQKYPYLNTYQYQMPERIYTDEDYSKYTLAIHPLALYNLSLKVDFEKRLRSKDEMLLLRLMGNYYDNTNYRVDSYEESSDEELPIWVDKFSDLKHLRGIGSGIGYKRFVYENSLYFSAIGTYNYYRVDYAKEQFSSYVDNDLVYYQSEYLGERQHFHKVGANVYLGMQSSLRHTFLLDWYLGFGYSYSFYDSNNRHFDRGFSNFGYRGVVVDAGVRLGFTFGKEKKKKK